MASLNLQRNSEVFFSTIDLINGAEVTAMTPSNTWKLEVLAGFAVTSSAATQDITSLESGTSPDRSQQRFNTAINPVDWNLVYLVLLVQKLALLLLALVQELTNQVT